MIFELASPAPPVQRRSTGEDDVHHRHHLAHGAELARRQREEQQGDQGRGQEEGDALVHRQATTLMSEEPIHAMTKAPGMVSTQAHTTRLATPHRTAESRRLAPTPTMAPVMVCVVETGMPAAEAKNKVLAAADSAASPPTGCSRVMRDPMVFTMRQPPDSVPRPMAVWAAS